VGSNRPAAIVLTARKVWPGYQTGRFYRHVVIRGGQVAGLADTPGEASEIAGTPSFWINLGPGCVGPGFIDTHIHALQAAADVRLVSLRGARTLDEVLAAVRERGRRGGAGDWTVSGRNWHESQLSDGRLPTTGELDALGVAGPVLLRRGSHLAAANSRARALLGLPAGGAAPIGSDAVIGRALELAGAPRPAQRAEDLAAVLARFNARGITSIREAGVDAAGLEAFAALHRDRRLTMRCDLLWRIAEGSDVAAARRQLADMPREAPPDGALAPRLAGVKLFADGRIADAATGDGAPPGALRLSPDDLWTIVTESLRRSPGLGCHAVGDAAVRMVLDAYERALAAGLARRPRQLVVEHALDCAPPTIERLAASGVSVSAHPGIVYEFAADVREHWGEARAARAAPVRDMLAAGVAVAAGSDGDVPPFDPLRGVWFMVTRMGRSGGPVGAGQAVPRDVALDLYTRRGAALLGAAGQRGELRPGQAADLVVFAADPLTCPIDELPDTGIALTLVGGRPVHDPSGLMEGMPDG
jgi:predicted amidohydrolase YtcJ